jgi:hypothetical protein
MDAPVTGEIFLISALKARNNDFETAEREKGHRVKKLRGAFAGYPMVGRGGITSPTFAYHTYQQTRTT